MITRHPRETEYYIEMRHFITNMSGERVLAGLTSAETDEFFAYMDSRAARQHRSSEQRDRWLKLHEKHEPARLAVIVAEAESRGATKN